MERKLDFIDECYKDKDLSLLKKQTLVIPTYNRNFYLFRCLWYHAHFPFGQIIVADSSLEEKKIVNRDTIRNIRETFGTDIMYLEYEPETEEYGGDIYRKWGDAILHVNSEYAQFCTDREFLIPTCCISSMIFLAQNPQHINAFYGRGDIIYSMNRNMIDITTNHHGIKSYEQNDPIERLSAFNSDCNIIENLFQVYKTDNLKKIYNNIINFRIDDLRFGEMYLEIEPFFLGKIRQEHGIGRFRDNTNISFTNEIQAKSSSSRHIHLDEYPEERINQLQNELVKSLLESLPSEYKTKNLDVETRDICMNIAWWWMNANNSKENIRKYKTNKMWVIKATRKSSPLLKHITDTIWHSLPQTIKCKLSKLIGNKSYISQPTIDKTDKMIQTILRCMSSEIMDSVK